MELPFQSSVEVAPNLERLATITVNLVRTLLFRSK